MKSINNIPILITSAVKAVAPYAINNQQFRILHTVNALKRLRILAPSNPIVICDGSGFNFSEILSYDFQLKSVEVLSFTNDLNAVRMRGKGYGEGEIVNYALKTSDLLKNADAFAKCTSKLWPDNFQSIMKQWKGGVLFDGVFSGLSDAPFFRLTQVHTKFYVCEKALFGETLSLAYGNVDDINGIYLEHAYLSELSARGVENYISPTPFIINGYSGTDGKFQILGKKEYYKERIKRKIMSCTSSGRQLLYR